MSKEYKILILRGIISSLLLGLAYFLPLENLIWLRITLYVLSYLTAGYDVIINAFKNIFKGEVFSEQFLMTIASVSAFIIAEYPEAVFIMFFYQIGEILSDLVADRSEDSIKSLLDMKVELTHVERDGETIDVNTEDVKPGEIILVKPGEKISLDGVVVSGESSLNTVAITGESMPRDIKPGEPVISGCINNESPLRIKVTKPYEESTIVKIVEMIEESQETKSKHEKFITRFSKIYTPVVVGLSVLVFLIPSLITKDWNTWLYRAVAMLVVSCPCALIVSIPLSYFGGVGFASKHGILIKGTNYIDALSKCNTVIFDKTGTITEGNFKVSDIITANGFTKDEVIKYASYAEYFSNHPIAISIKNEYKEKIDEKEISEVTEYSGHGIGAKVSGKQVLAGNEKLMIDSKIEYEKSEKGASTVVYVSVDGQFAGYILIKDEIKNTSQEAINKLKNMNVKTVMLTGDRHDVAEDVSSRLGINEFKSDLLPQDKVDAVNAYISSNEKNMKVAFAGDGVNDAPVIASSDVGISMGSMGSDLAVEASDVVIMDDNPSKIADAITISKKTKKIATQNLIFSIAVKVAILILGMIGISKIGISVFGDVGVLILVTLNATRTLRIKF